MSRLTTTSSMTASSSEGRKASIAAFTTSCLTVRLKGALSRAGIVREAADSLNLLVSVPCESNNLA